MKPMYDADNRYLPDTLELDKRVADALKPLFKEFCGRGYNPRHISHIILLSAMSVELEEVL